MKLSLDFEPKEVAQIVVSMKLMNWGLYSASILLCYRKHPLIYLDQRFRLQQRLSARFPSIHSWGNRVYQNTTQFVMNNKHYKSFVSKLNLDPENLTHSVAEASLLFKGLFPVSFPITLFSTIKLVSMYNEKLVSVNAEIHDK